MSVYKYVFVLVISLMACKNDAPAKISPDVTPTPPAKVDRKQPEPSKQAEVSKPAPTEKVDLKESTAAPTTQKRSSGKIDTVSVSNLEELVANAKDNTVMYLNKGKYELETNLVYYMTKDERKIIDKNKVQTKSIGGQLYFAGLENFQLIGKNGSKVVSKNPAAVVLYVVKSKNLKFSNLTITKEVEGKIDLSYISNCKNVEIEKCKFDGGGTYGMYLSYVEDIRVNSCNINNCTSGAMKIHIAKGVKILNSSLSNNILKLPIISFYDSGSDVIFKNVVIRDNQKDTKSTVKNSDKIFASMNNMITLENCVIQNNRGFTQLGLSMESLKKSQIEGVSIP